MIKTNFKLSDDYSHIVSIAECQVPDKYEFKIKSKWEGAKNPDDLESKFSWTMTERDLRKLRNMIDEALTSLAIKGISNLENYNDKME